MPTSCVCVLLLMVYGGYAHQNVSVALNLSNISPFERSHYKLQPKSNWKFVNSPEPGKFIRVNNPFFGSKPLGHRASSKKRAKGYLLSEATRKGDQPKRKSIKRSKSAPAPSHIRKASNVTVGYRGRPYQRKGVFTFWGNRKANNKSIIR